MKQELREQVLKRDDNQCQLCQCDNKRLEVHHIIPRRYGGLDIEDNLVTVCRACHAKMEPPRNFRYKLETGIKTIIVSKETRDKLKEMGKKGESYDDVLRRVLKL